MDYYKINYEKLQRLYQIKFIIIVIFIIFLFIILALYSLTFKIDKVISCYGIAEDNKLKIKIESELSDTLKNGNKLSFNGTFTTYWISEFSSYDIVDNIVFEEVYLTVDKKFYDNEVGIVELHYGKQKLLTYILELFE